MTSENQAPDSKFAYVVLAARRARQLMAGAPVLIDHAKSHKFTRLAVEELDAGALEFELPIRPETAEEKERKHRSE
jgi:DNA-directed RNA polymerase omega subunit